jgi:hypothetical protein
MALTPLRWVAIAVAAMLGFIVLSWGGLRPEYQPTPDERREVILSLKSSLHSRRAFTFARQLRMMQLTDSLRVALPRGTEAVRGFYSRDVNPAIRSAMDTALARAREKTGATPRMGVDVVTLSDTTPVGGVNPWGSYHTPFYILPSRATDRCIVVLPAGRGVSPLAQAQNLNTEDSRLQVLGPCAFYAAFGLPGDSIRQWLRTRGAVLAFGGSWTQHSGFQKTEPDAYYHPPVYYPGPPSVFYTLSGRAVSCVVGNTADCEAVLTDRMATPMPMAVGSALRPGIRLGPIDRTAGADFRGRETEILSDMVRSLGHERFQRFWTSNEPLPTAFQSASGMPLGEWVSVWGGERVDRIEHGPVPRAMSVVSAIVIMVACILWVVLASTRRVFA